MFIKKKKKKVLQLVTETQYNLRDKECPKWQFFLKKIMSSNSKLKVYCLEKDR